MSTCRTGARVDVCLWFALDVVRLVTVIAPLLLEDCSLFVGGTRSGIYAALRFDNSLELDGTDDSLSPGIVDVVMGSLPLEVRLGRVFGSPAEVSAPDIPVGKRLS
jgi:hypothetical protein